MNMKLPPLEAFQRKLLHQGTKDFAWFKEATRPFRKKVWNIGDMFMAHCEFQETMGVSEGRKR